MYEYSNVERLVSQLKERANGSAHVHEVHLRKGAIFSAVELRKAYDSLTDHTALEGSELVIDQNEFVHYCDDCGYTQTISESDLVGRLFICPECGGTMEFDESEDLELVDVKFD